jgi:hypothetical protein
MFNACTFLVHCEESSTDARDRLYHYEALIFEQFKSNQVHRLSEEIQSNRWVGSKSSVVLSHDGSCITSTLEG